MKILLFALLLFLAACGGPPPPQPTATVEGLIRFDGPRPTMPTISMEAEEACTKLHATPVLDSSALVNADGGLANVFVYVKSGLEKHSFAPPLETVTIEQKGCQFIPRVIGVRKGQTIAVKNSDPVTHNIHPMPKNNRDWNQSQAPGAEDLKRRFGFPEVMIPVKCNVHAWMRSYIAVLEHPFFAVTGLDGRYRFTGLPPGEYVVAAWHEKFGERTQKITVAPGATINLPLSFVPNLP